MAIAFYQNRCPADVRRMPRSPLLPAAKVLQDLLDNFRVPPHQVVDCWTGGTSLARIPARSVRTANGRA